MYSAAVSSSRLPVTMITGVCGASWKAICSAWDALNDGREWSVRIRSGAKLRSASRKAGSVCTRRVAEEIPARRSSRSTSVASSAASSTIRTRVSAGTLRSALGPRSVLGRFCGTEGRFCGTSSVQLRLDVLAVALRADAVAELGLGPPFDIPLERAPLVLIVPDALAIAANRQQALEGVELLAQPEDALGDP